MEMKDLRKASCGGDPLGFMKRAVKSASGSLKSGDEVAFIFNPERFNLGPAVLQVIAGQNGMSISEQNQVSSEEAHVRFRRI